MVRSLGGETRGAGGWGLDTRADTGAREHQIGLYQGANMGLLKTVFEVNLSLFGGSDASKAKSSDKTLILFVIRDHVGATPLSNLTATLTADMEKIWASLSKVGESGHRFAMGRCMIALAAAHLSHHVPSR